MNTAGMVVEYSIELWKFLTQLRLSELAISWQHALPREDPVYSQGCSSWWTELCSTDSSQIALSPICNIVEKHDLSTPGCCPGVADCCFADELLSCVQTEQLPSVYLCVGSSRLSSPMPSNCEWEFQAHIHKKHSVAGAECYIQTACIILWKWIVKGC